MTERNEKGQFVQKKVEERTPEEKENERQAVIQLLEMAGKEHDKRMQEIDKEFLAHTKRQKLIDWLMIIALSSMVGYYAGIALAIMF